MMQTGNLHCSVVEIAGNGILIEGDSGSGKTSLAFGLVESALSKKADAKFVADDQAILATRSGKLIASSAAPIRGMAEVRGFGIVKVDHKSETEIRLLVRIVDDRNIERMPEARKEILAGVELPMVEVPRRHEAGAVRIVLAQLGLLNQFRVCK